VFSDCAGVLIFAYDPEGKSTVVVLPDKVTADDMIKCLEAEGWEIQEPTYDVDVELEEDDEEDDDTGEYSLTGADLDDD